MLVQLLDFVTVIDRVLDELLDGVQVGVANGGQPGAVIEFTIPSASNVLAKDAVPA